MSIIWYNILCQESKRHKLTVYGFLLSVRECRSYILCSFDIEHKKSEGEAKGNQKLLCYQAEQPGREDGE